MSPEPTSLPGEKSQSEKSLAEQVLDTAPDLEALLDQVLSRPDQVIPPSLKDRALVGTAHLFGADRPEQMTADLERERQELLRFARDAVEKLRQGRGREIEVPLTEEEQRGAQALLSFITRPALLVRNGEFVEPPAQWESLERRRDRIQKTFGSVGRIEISGHPEGKLWSGTGWVVADGLVITNRHVVRDFAEPVNGQAGETRWRLKPGMSARINFGEDWLGTGPPPEDASRTHDVPEDAVLKVYPQDGPDLALVPVRPLSRTGEKLPGRLPIDWSGGGIGEGRQVYTVGFPARDERSREIRSMYRLFEGTFDVKRLQPGQVMELLPESSTLLHDCSTLGGNSGSCVVDLTTNRVVALHYGGFHRHANLAVALWMLGQDPLLREAGVTDA